MNLKVTRPILLLAILIVILFGQFSSKTGASLLSSRDGMGYMFVAIGYVFLAVRGVLWLFLLRIMDLSKAYPLQSLSYVLVLVLSYIKFDEEVGAHQVFGCVIIMVGSLMIYRD